MHLKVPILETEKTLKTLSSGQIHKKNQKNPKCPKNPLVWVFKKPGFFPTLGQVLPGAVILIVEGSVICKTDEVGEIVVSSPATASSYWGLPGLTQSTFKVEFIFLDEG
jgi:hypothetical protein